MTRQFFFDAWHWLLLRSAAASKDQRIAEIAAKAIKEVAYHLERSRDWMHPPRRRHRGEPSPRAGRRRPLSGRTPASCSSPTRSTRHRRRRLAAGSRALRQPWLDLVGRTLSRGHPRPARPRCLDAAGRQARPAHRASGLPPGRDAVRPPRLSGSDLVTANGQPDPSVEQVWAWLGEVPDPEIPAVSVVDLGIVRDVRWERRRTRGHRHADLFRLPRHRLHLARDREALAGEGARRTSGWSGGSRRPGPPTGSPQAGRERAARLRHRPAGRQGGRPRRGSLARASRWRSPARAAAPTTPRGSASSARPRARRSTAAGRAWSPSTTSSATDGDLPSAHRHRHQARDPRFRSS